MSAKIEVILFDLGGVLVELGALSENTAWFKPELSERENWELWLSAPQSQALERGEISPREFATEFIRSNNIDTDVDTFLDTFKNWVVGFYPGALNLLKKLSRQYSLGVYSNITDVHWPRIEQELKSTGAIHHYFASYIIGQAKPDVAAFRYVAAEMQITPEKILFVDDNAINVAGAIEAGMQSAVVKGFPELEPTLSRFGIEAS